MLDGARIGLKVDVDTLRGTREGVPRLMALFKKHGVDATFYFSVGPDHTGRAMRRVFRKGFAQKVARTSVLKHYGLKTLLYGVLLPGPDIGRNAGGVMRSVHDAGFEVGLHTYDHVRWQDYVAKATAAWTRVEFERGIEGFRRVFDEIMGVGGVDESSIADAVFRLSADAAAEDGLQVFTLHAELEGMLLLDAFESLLVKWRQSGAAITRMAKIHEAAMRRPLPTRAVVMGEVAGRSGVLAVQAPSGAAPASGAARA
jgi:undecaprenyl phosphate-alpha-L-ara4FN deformylase